MKINEFVAEVNALSFMVCRSVREDDIVTIRTLNADILAHIYNDDDIRYELIDENISQIDREIADELFALVFSYTESLREENE